MKKFFTILLFGLFCLPYGYAQKDSVAIYKAIIEKDTIPLDLSLEYLDKCIAWTKKNQDLFSETDFVIKKGEVLFHQSKYEESISLLTNQHFILQKALKNKSPSQLKKWEKLHVDLLASLGRAETYFGIEDEAILSYKTLIQLYGQDTLSYGYAKALNGMGIVMSIRKHWELSKNYFQRALVIFQQLGDKKGIYIASSNLGGILLELQLYNEALSSFLDAQKIVLDEHYTGKEIIYTGLHLGIAYSYLKRFDIADKYFMEVLTLAIQKNHDHIITHARLYYTLNLIQQKNFQEALKQANIALSEARKGGRQSLALEVYRVLAKIYTETGQYKNAIDCFNNVLILNDSVFNNEHGEKLLGLKFQFDNYKSIQEQKLQELKIVKRNWIIVLLILISACFFPLCWFLIRNIRREKLINRLIEKELVDMRFKECQQEEVGAFENPKGVSSMKNTADAIFALKFSELAEDLSRKVKFFKVNFMLKAKEKKAIEEMEDVLKEFTPNNDWNEFKLYFEQVDRNFLSKLDKKYPHLTANEKRLCALIHLNLSAKEIAYLTSRTFQSIGTAKFRLKKKLELAAETDLYEFFSQL